MKAVYLSAADKGWNVRSKGGRDGRDERRAKLPQTQDDRCDERNGEEKRRGKVGQSGAKVRKRGFRGSYCQPFAS